MPRGNRPAWQKSVDIQAQPVADAFAAAAPKGSAFRQVLDYVGGAAGEFLGPNNPPVNMALKGWEALNHNDPMGAMGMAMPAMTAYHGSPHIFDRPSLASIGTGEGAQAYGHGLYATSSPKLADTAYREGLLKRKGVKPPLLIAGKEAPTGFVKDASGADLLPHDHAINMDLQAAMNRGKRHLGLDGEELVQWAYDDVLKQAEKDAARIRESTPLPGSREAIEHPTLRAYYENRLAAAKAVDPKSLSMGTAGSFHVWDIPEMDELMHFDKPMSEQQHILDKLPPKVRQSLEDMLDEHMQPALEDLTGSQFYQVIKREASEGNLPGQGDTLNNARDASEFLRSLGVPGHSYVGDTSGVRNFVVYDDAAIKPIARYPSLAEYLASQGAAK